LPSSLPFPSLYTLQAILGQSVDIYNVEGGKGGREKKEKGFSPRFLDDSTQSSLLPPPSLPTPLCPALFKAAGMTGVCG